MKIEYKQVYAYLDGNESGYKFTVHNESSLAQLGADGWEIVTTQEITTKARMDGIVIILKREKK